MTQTLDDRVVVVAGANGPAGQAAARRLAAGGARVVAVARRRADWDDPRISAVAADLLDPEAVHALAEQVRAEHGRVDGLIHLVGGWRGGSTFDGTDLADWAFLHDTLIRTLQHTTLAFAGPLREAGGRVAIVSQQGAQRPEQGSAAYATAKAASEAWTLALADSFAGTDAAAVVLVVKALLTGAMQAERPDHPFPGFTHVDDLAEVIAGLWDRPAAELNGTRLDLAHH
ncbi:SDR family oxidoreductase [Actinomadura macrotermitis]|uniref:Putative oxidoreductase n=1 Tax=Actinomadura macrotermitis TaxID=2585200 RepID=A0A7K0C7H2_9ACTN|nr:SDR family oxidoreductase [Actinomadura macrotermitis]MQY09407.1 putative oxidoreductase [Actinomadura macrotermitis]